MGYAIRLLEQDRDNLLAFNYRASRFPCAESEKDIELNKAKIEQLETAIQKLKSGHCTECKIAQENLELIGENQKLRGEK